MAQGQKICKDFVLEDSFLITNVGRFKLPESCMPYVVDYGAVLPCAVQPFAMLVSSFGDRMKLSVAQRDHDMEVVEMLCAGPARDRTWRPKTLSYPFRIHPLQRAGVRPDLSVIRLVKKQRFGIAKALFLPVRSGNGQVKAVAGLAAERDSRRRPAASPGCPL